MVETVVSGAEGCSSCIRGLDARYLTTMESQDRKRFEEKLKVSIGDDLFEIRNPYEIWNSPVLSDKPTMWPDIGFGDLWSYLVEKPVGIVYSQKVKESSGVFILKAACTSSSIIVNFSLPTPPFPGCFRGGLGNKDPQNPKESWCVFKSREKNSTFTDNN